MKNVTRNIDCWFHSGKVGVTEPTLCLYHAANDVGCEVLDGLELIGVDSRAKQVFRFVRCERAGALEKLTGELVAAGDELQVMLIACDRDQASIKVTPDGLVLL